MSKFEKELIGALKEINTSIKHLDSQLSTIVAQNAEVTKSKCKLLDTTYELVSAFDEQLPGVIDSIINQPQKPDHKEDEDDGEDDDIDNDEVDDDDDDDENYEEEEF